MSGVEKVAVILETTNNHDVWGRVYYEDDLLVDSASTIGALEKK